MTSDQSELKQLVTFRFRQPFLRPGTPDAVHHGCLCFERDLQGEPMSDAQDGDYTVAIHEDCPLHKIIKGTTDPE